MSSCGSTISPTTQGFSASGASGTVAVTATGGCGWAAVSNDAWITVTSGGAGNGNGTVNYDVEPNTGPARSGNGTVNFTVDPNSGPAREAQLTIGGQTFTVTQDSAWTYSLSLTSQ